jgi:translation initiation factor 4B
VTPPTAPAERKKLDLKPRSAAPAEGAETPGASSTNKSNPFGGAKPVDVMERERQIEERLQAQREQRAAEEKAKQEKIKAEKAEKEAALKGAPTGPRADREKAGGAAGAPTGPRAAGTGRTPSKRGEGVRSPTTDAASAAPTSDAAAAGSASPAATPTSPPAAPAIKSPPAAGAWGKGRKASGALLGNSAAAAAAAPTNGSAESKDGEDAVAEVSEGVAKAQVAE